MVIGIMGYSGSGKSTFAKEMENLGAYVIDADKIGKDILEVGTPAYKEVVAYFGDSILEKNKSINRKKLGQTVFSDKDKLEILNKITWNEINRIIIKKVEESNSKVIVIDCPLLYKVSSYNLCDEVIFINSKEEELIERIVKRDNIDKETAKNRLNSQKDDEFLKKATMVIENNGLSYLKIKAKSLMEGWLKWQAI